MYDSDSVSSSYPCSFKQLILRMLNLIIFIACFCSREHAERHVCFTRQLNTRTVVTIGPKSLMQNNEDEQKAKKLYAQVFLVLVYINLVQGEEIKSHTKNNALFTFH